MANMRFDFKAANNLDITDVARKLGMKLTKRGVRYVTNCPWHADKNPSLTLYEHSCYCFACGKRGSVIDLVMRTLTPTLSLKGEGVPSGEEGISLKEAMEWLESHYPQIKKGPHLTSPRRGGTPCGVRRLSVFEMNELISGPDTLHSTPSLRGRDGEGPCPYFLDMSLLTMDGIESSFGKCLLRMFPRERVELVCRLYCLSTWRDKNCLDDVMFPSIDVQKRLHNVKIQGYDCAPGSDCFFHCNKKHIFWLGDILKKRMKIPYDAVFDNSTMFGEHLLSENPNETVMLVESPKNAIVGALHDLTRVWVATGNKGQLKRQVLLPLRGRRVIVIPDNDAVEEWTEKINAMRDLAEFSISSFSEVLKKECGEKGDVADWGKELIHNS